MQSSCPLNLFVHSDGIFSDRAGSSKKKNSTYKIVFNLKHGRKPSAETARRVLGASISVIDCAERNVPGCCGVRVFLNYSSFSREEDITCLCRNISHVNSCAV